MLSNDPLAQSNFPNHGSTVKRSIIIGVFITAQLALLSGCSGTGNNPQGRTHDGTETAGPSSKLPPGPKPEELFATAVAKLNGQNLRYTIEDEKGEKMIGLFDARSAGNQLSASVEGARMDFIVFGDDVYIGGLAGVKSSWLHAQASKFKDNVVSLMIVIDPLFGEKFLSTAAGVKQDQATTFSGTVDLTKVSVTGPSKRLADRFAIAAGPAATALPFTATLDDSGALSTVRMTFPKADLGGKDLKYDLTVTEVGGNTVTVAAPPKNKVTEAPSSIYSGP